MPEEDAANFFRRRRKRAVKSQDEIDGEELYALWGICVVAVVVDVVNVLVSNGV